MHRCACELYISLANLNNHSENRTNGYRTENFLYHTSFNQKAMYCQSLFMFYIPMIAEMDWRKETFPYYCIWLLVRSKFQWLFHMLGYSNYESELRTIVIDLCNMDLKKSFKKVFNFILLCQIAFIAACLLDSAILKH